MVALAVGLVAFQNWLEQPLDDPPAFPIGWTWLLIVAIMWVLSHDRVEDWIGRFNLAAPGVWRTTRTARLRPISLVLFMFALLAVMVEISWAHWRRDDEPRLAGAAFASLVLLGGMVRGVLETWQARVELRIDGEGVFAPAWRGTAPWEVIEFVVQPRRGRELSLMLKPGGDIGGREGLLTLSLAPTGLYPDEALIALRAVRPDLRIEPWTSNGFVLPIHGATDVADPVKVTTYG